MKCGIIKNSLFPLLLSYHNYHLLKIIDNELFGRILTIRRSLITLNDSLKSMKIFGILFFGGAGRVFHNQNHDHKLIRKILNFEQCL